MKKTDAKKYLLVIFILFTSGRLLAQSLDFGKLTKEDYYRDFDSLQAWITRISPIYLVNDKLKGQDFQVEMKKLRRKLANVNSNQEFLRIIGHALNLVQDPHASLVTNRNMSGPSMLYPAADTIYINESCTYYDQISKAQANIDRVRLRLPLKYVDGKYIVYYPFHLNGKFIDSGYVVSRVNKMNIHDAIRRSIIEIPVLRYDFIRNISYYDNFYRLKRFYDNGDSSINLEFSKSKDIRTISCTRFDSATFDKKISFIGFNSSSAARKVIYFDSLDILYIRMPLMDDGAYFINEIKKYLQKTPGKIVFDIRGNGGGQDWVYVSPLKLIIKAQQVAIPFYVGIRSNSFSMNGIKNWLHESVFTMQQQHEKFSYLPGEEFVTFKTDTGNYYKPDSLSMNYAGNIYLLCHGYEYSSTGNFIDLARTNVNIVSVGMTTGLFGGIEFSPRTFMLPKSKIIFRQAGNLDFKNVTSLRDLYHNYIEIPCNYSVTDMYHIAQNNGDVSDLPFLLNKDPLFKKIVALPKR